MIRRLSLRLLERLYQKVEQKSRLVNDKIEEYKMKAAELGQTPDSARIEQYRNQPGLNIWLAEDCAGYRRGRKIDDNVLKKTRQKGYETVWVSDRPLQDYEEMPGKHGRVLSLRNRMIAKLGDLFKPIDEKDAGVQKPGSKIRLLETNDLLRLKINALQREGVARLAAKYFGEGGKRLDFVAQLALEVYNTGLTAINLADNRTLGNTLVLRDSEDVHTNVEVSNYLVNHSVNVGIYFTLTLRNIQSERIEMGSQSSSARYTAGQKYKEEYSVAHSQSVVEMACAGAFLYDLGFNHVALKAIMEKEMQDLIGPEGQALERGFHMVNESEYLTLKKHVNAGAHLVQNLGVEKTAIISSMIRTHHAYLNGQGYPRRKGRDFHLSMQDDEGNKRIVKVHKYNFAIHELTNLLSIIDTYDAMINRRPWRLPFSRYDAVEYLYRNSCYRINHATAVEDTKGILAFAGDEQRTARFDRYLVNKFLHTVRPYAVNEMLPLRDMESNKKITEAVVVRYGDVPHRPVVRIKARGQIMEMDLSDPGNCKYYLGEYINTASLKKTDAKGDQMQCLERTDQGEPLS